MAPGTTISSPRRFQQLAVPVFCASLIDRLVAWERLKGDQTLMRSITLHERSVLRMADMVNRTKVSSTFTMKCAGGKSANLFLCLKSIATKPDHRLLQQNRLGNTEILKYCKCANEMQHGMEYGAWSMESGPSMRFLAPVQLLLLVSHHALQNLFYQSLLSIVD